MAHVAFQLVQVVPSVSIENGVVLVKGEKWGLCCSPQILRDFCANSIEVLNLPPEPDGPGLVRFPKKRKKR